MHFSTPRRLTVIVSTLVLAATGWAADGNTSNGGEAEETPGVYHASTDDGHCADVWRMGPNADSDVDASDRTNTAAMCCISKDPPQLDYSIIKFHTPAKDLISEGLPIGNGRMGMLVQGGIGHESDAICEDSVWSGWENDKADNPEAAKYLPQIRKLFAEGKISEAQKLIEKTQISRMDDGKGHNTYDAYGSYQMLARLEIETGQAEAKVTHYSRELDMNWGIVTVDYKIDDTRYTREYFASHPDQVQVIRFTADKPGSISFSATLTRPETNATVRSDDDDAILLSGWMSGKDGGKALEYACRMGATHKGGTLVASDDGIVATDCDEVILYVTAGTNYLGLNHWPDYLDKSGAYLRKTKVQLNAARQLPFKKLCTNSSLDVSEHLFGTDFDTSDEGNAGIYVPARLERTKDTGKADHVLLSTYFNYGRYLLLSSSRDGSLPANLQGLWTVNYKNGQGHWEYWTPWCGDYHANINIQMNYWPVFSANLAECAGPMYDLIEALPGPGTVTAKTQHGCDGWTTHTMNNIWGFTSPGWEASWGHFPMAGPWMATHIWTGYEYTLDKQFLQRMWPALKGSSEFVLSWLTPDKNGRLVSGPSESPENRFTLSDGTTGYFCMGPSMDQELCAQLLDETLRSAQVLGIADNFTKKCAAALAKVRPVGIGPDGRLLEWTEPYDEPEPGHRHTSHLFGLWPGTTISVDKTPALAKAARKSLDYRTAHGGGYTGWSRADMIGKWARLHDGEKAYENLVALLKNSTLPNLFDTHPPFQIDGNFGATAAIIEMLMQSTLEHDGSTTIELLPALPSEWPNGSLSGVVARGNVTVSVCWMDGKLALATLSAKQDITVLLKYGTATVQCTLTAGRQQIFEMQRNGVLIEKRQEDLP